MMDLKYKINGADKIIESLSKLSSKVQKSTVRKAARRAMKPVLEAAKENAKRIDDPKTKNSIRRNLAIVENAKAGRRIGGVVMRVGVRGGAKKVKDTGLAGGDTFYWRFVEFGTKNARAQPFLRPAFNGNQETVIEIFVSEVEKDIGSK